MDMKRRIKQVWGGFVILLGCGFALPLLLRVASGQLADLWTIDQIGS